MKMDRHDGGGSGMVLAIECMAGSSKAEEWSGGGEGVEAALQTGDILEEITFVFSPPLRSPFKGGRAAAVKLLHAAFKRGDTSVLLKARRGRAGDPDAASVELHACIVPHPAAGRRQYLLRSISDPNHVVDLVGRTEAECIALHGSRSSRVVCALSNTQLQDGYVSYPWEKKMRESLQMPSSSCFLSLLILPQQCDPSGTRYNSVEDTLARANAWLNSSQASGVPIVFMNLQTEALLTKISGETASSTVNMGSLADLPSLANASLYGFEDYHGLDIGVVRAVRLWYTPKSGEMPLEIKLQEGDTKLGFSISRTEEGFIYISSVTDDEDNHGVPAARSGLIQLFREARKASKLLVISRVGNEKVLPWMVSSSGAIRCFDTVSLSQKLSLHRHAMKPILLHLIMWEMLPSTLTKVVDKFATTTPFVLHSQATDEEATTPIAPFVPTSPVDEALQDLLYIVDSDIVDSDTVDSEDSLSRDLVGDVSFRFNDLSINTSNWL